MNIKVTEVEHGGGLWVGFDDNRKPGTREAGSVRLHRSSAGFCPDTGPVVSRLYRTQGIADYLNAAALTCVTASTSTLITLLYFLLKSGLLGERRQLITWSGLLKKYFVNRFIGVKYHELKK